MITLNLDAVREVNYAIDDLYGYLTDNSCGDPDCCGGPYYTEEDFKRASAILLKHGIEFAP